MGAALSHPIRNKMVHRARAEWGYAASCEMQGFRMNMEDEATMRMSLEPKHPGLSFFAVFDGHAGAACSLFLRDALHTAVSAMTDPTDETELVATIKAVDADFCTREDVRNHGSTCTCAVLKHNDDGTTDITVANVGDSRIMLLSPRDGTFKWLTVDHKPSLPQEWARITAAGSYVQADRVRGQLAMSRAIGDYTYKQKDLPVEQQEVIPVAEVQTATAQPGDLLFLCCDGIVEQLENEQVVEFILARVRHQYRDCPDTDPATTGDDGARAGPEDVAAAAAMATTHDFAAVGIPRTVDLARVLRELLERCLKSGSKDNMTAMLVGMSRLPADVTVAQETTTLQPESARRTEQFYAGPYHPFAGDTSFCDAYRDDARKHGYEGEELMALARETERTFVVEEPAGGPGGMGGPGGGMGGPGGGMGGMFALQQLLSGGLGGGPGGDGDDEDGEGGGAGGGDGDRMQAMQLLAALMQAQGGGGMGGGPGGGGGMDGLLAGMMGGADGDDDDLDGRDADTAADSAQLEELDD